MPEEEPNTSSNNNVKWIVIGAIAIVILFLFKDQIGALIDRTESVSISNDGLVLKTRTIDTALGETIVSGPPTIETAGVTAEAASSFTSDDGFKINWKPELWSANQQLAKENDAALFLLFSIPDGFQPSISVESHEGFSSAKSYLESVSYPKRQVSQVEFGPSGETGVRTSIGEFAGSTFYYIERVLFNSNTGLVYVATAKRPVKEEGNAELWDSTRKVLNSFRLG
jgi:hypothetical protein